MRDGERISGAAPPLPVSFPFPELFILRASKLTSSDYYGEKKIAILWHL